MSVVQACAQAEAVIQRARSLFATAAVAPTDSAADRLGAASQTTAATAQMTGDNSGVLIKRHTAFADKNAVALSGAGHTDAALDAHAARAATLTQTGAQRLDAIAAQTRATTQAATTARTPAAQRVILTAVRSQVAQAQNVVNTTTTQASGLAGQVRALKYPPPAGGHGDTQALGFGPGGTPQTPADKEPPHGKDPRYWIDVGKIIYVPDGKLAPANTVQIGPNMYYPAPYIPDAVVPPPDPVKHPLDIPDVRTVGPDQLLPPGYRLVAPGIGLPDPDAYFQPQPPWTPKQPVDVRDVIQVPADQLAPWGYVEYLPGWWAPGSQLTNTTNIRLRSRSCILLDRRDGAGVHTKSERPVGIPAPGWARRYSSGVSPGQRSFASASTAARNRARRCWSASHAVGDHTKSERPVGIPA